MCVYIYIYVCVYRERESEREKERETYSDSFPLHTAYSFLCHTVGLCYLSILYILVCIC